MKKVSKPPMVLSLDDVFAGEDGGSDSNGRPGYRSDGSSQRRPKNTSTDDSTSIKKHPKSNIAATLNFHPISPQKIPADEDRRPGRNSPLASNEKTADSPGLARRTTFASTQFREDLSESRQLKDTFAVDSSSSQSKPKGNIADGFTSNPKHPIGYGFDFDPGQPKNTSTDELSSNPKHSDSTIRDHSQFNSGQPKNISTDELSSNPKHSNSTIRDRTQFNSGQPKNISTDELSSNLKHSKSTIVGSTKFNSGQPKNTSTDELSSNPKHSKSTIRDNTKFNSGQPKNTSTDELSSNPKPSKSTIGDSTKFSSGQLKNTSTDESSSNPKHSKSTIADSTKFNSGQPKNTSTDKLNSNPNHSKSTIEDSTKFSSRQPKKTSTDEFNSSPNYSKSTISDGTKFNSGQPKNTSTDELSSNPTHSKSTIGDNTKFNFGQPKNTSTDELNWNLKLPKNHIGDSVNFKPSNPQNSSPDEFLLNPRNPEDLSTSSSNRSSLMAAGWSSSSFPTVNSPTATNSKNHLDQKPLSTEFLVDPAAHTYISVFMKDTIDDILGQSSVEMKTETGDGYNTVILTAKSPHLSQQFYKAARETSDIFIKCQRFLRVERIDLSTISADVTKQLQFYLYKCGIWSSPNGESLQMIGPYEDIVGFMKKWTSAGGDFATFVHLSQEDASPGSSRPPVVGMDNIHRSTTRDHNVTHDVHNQRVGSDGRGEEPGAGGGSRGLDTASRSKTPSDKP
ncbi:uncharacterized protein LOC143997773 isoform X2 [Lithobates pipiens]